MSPAPKDAPMIFAAMAAVMADVDSVGKTGVNKEQGYKFRSIEDVMNAVRKGLVKHGVFYLPTVLNRVPEARQTRGGTAMNTIHLEIRYDFYAADGSSVSSVVWGEGADMADKATNKAMSAALKYNLVQAFSIAADGALEDSDSSAAEAGPNYGSAGAAFDAATPASPRSQQPGNGHVTRPAQASKPAGAPRGETDPDAQPYADDAHQATSLAAIKDVHTRARDARKLAALVANPATGGIGGLGQYLNWRRKQLEEADAALTGLTEAAKIAGFPASDLDAHVRKVTGADLEAATAAQLRQAAEAIPAGVPG